MSQKAGNAPLPWSWEIDEDQQLMLYDAEGNVLRQLYDQGCEAEAQALCDAVNNEWVHKHNAEEAAEYIEFLKDRNRELGAEIVKLKELVKRMVPCVKSQKNAMGDFQTLMDLIHEAKAALGEE